MMLFDTIQVYLQVQRHLLETKDKLLQLLELASPMDL